MKENPKSAQVTNYNLMEENPKSALDTNVTI